MALVQEERSQSGVHYPDSGHANILGPRDVAGVGGAGVRPTEVKLWRHEKMYHVNMWSVFNRTRGLSNPHRKMVIARDFAATEDLMNTCISRARQPWGRRALLAP